MRLYDTSLTVFSTARVGLKNWVATGTVDRELEIYKRLLPNLKNINLVSYGGNADNQYQNLLGGINLLPTNWKNRRWQVYLSLLASYFPQLRDTDIVKTNQILGSEIALWVKRVFRAKLIIRCGYLLSYFSNKKELGKAAKRRHINIEKKAFENADIGIVTSHKDRSYVIEKYNTDPKKIKVVPNYVVTDIFRPNKTSPKKYDLVFVGRKSKQKNILSLLTAMEYLRSKGQSISLLMIGTCCEDDRVIDFSKRRNLDVTLKGSVPNYELPNFFNQSRLFILPSLYEGHPKTLLEAMSCGLPCIGTDVIGIREDIKHKRTGYLCGIDYQGIGNAIDALLKDKTLQMVLAENGRKYILENYSIDRILGMLIEIYEELIRE